MFVMTPLFKQRERRNLVIWYDFGKVCLKPSLAGHLGNSVSLVLFSGHIAETMQGMS